MRACGRHAGQVPSVWPIPEEIILEAAVSRVDQILAYQQAPGRPGVAPGRVVHFDCLRLRCAARLGAGRTAIRGVLGHAVAIHALCLAHVSRRVGCRRRHGTGWRGQDVGGCEGGAGRGYNQANHDAVSDRAPTSRSGATRPRQRRHVRIGVLGQYFESWGSGGVHQMDQSEVNA